MLFKARFGPLIAAGEVTETWRTWARPQAKVGGKYGVVGGSLIQVASVDRVPLSEADDAAARASGFPDVVAMIADLRKRRPDVGGDDLVWRVRFRYLGPDDRPRAHEAPAEISPAEREKIERRLAGYDARSPHGPWTEATLGLIADHPTRRAADLAELLGWERLPFKANVRKLKALGLTESLDVGYRLSPRGQTYLRGVRSGWRR